MVVVPWSDIRWYPTHPKIVYSFNPQPGNSHTSCGHLHAHPLSALACGQFRAPKGTLFNSIERIYLDGSDLRDRFPIEPRPEDFARTDFNPCPFLRPPVPL